MILPNVEIKKILYATDLSESAIHAFAYAVSLADHYKAGITILHVLFGDPDREAVIRNVLSDKQWSEIKERHYEDARQQLIGKKREHVEMKEVIHAFAENIKKESGIPDQRIQESTLCTFCEKDRFPSYRRCPTPGKRIYNFLLLKAPAE